MGIGSALNFAAGNLSQQLELERLRQDRDRAKQEANQQVIAQLIGAGSNALQGIGGMVQHSQDVQRGQKNWEADFAQNASHQAAVEKQAADELARQKSNDVFNQGRQLTQDEQDRLGLELPGVATELSLSGAKPGLTSPSAASPTGHTAGADFLDLAPVSNKPGDPRLSTKLGDIGAGFDKALGGAGIDSSPKLPLVDLQGQEVPGTGGKAQADIQKAADHLDNFANAVGQEGKPDVNAAFNSAVDRLAAAHPHLSRESIRNQVLNASQSNQDKLTAEARQAAGDVRAEKTLTSETALRAAQASEAYARGSAAKEAAGLRGQPKINLVELANGMDGQIKALATQNKDDEQNMLLARPSERSVIQARIDDRNAQIAGVKNQYDQLVNRLTATPGQASPTPATGPATPSSGAVLMKSPVDGKTRPIPADKVGQAKAAGYVEVQ